MQVVSQKNLYLKVSTFVGIENIQLYTNYSSKKTEALAETISQFDICFVLFMFIVVPEQSSHVYYTNTVDYCATLCLAEGYPLIAVTVSRTHILDKLLERISFVFRKQISMQLIVHTMFFVCSKTFFWNEESTINSRFMYCV